MDPHEPAGYPEPPSDDIGTVRRELLGSARPLPGYREARGSTARQDFLPRLLRNGLVGEILRSDPGIGWKLGQLLLHELLVEDLLPLQLLEKLPHRLGNRKLQRLAKEV